MVMDEGDSDSRMERKRKFTSIEGVKSVYLLFSSEYSRKAAGLCEIKIQINKESESDQLKSIESVDGLRLVPKLTFYEQIIDKDLPRCVFSVSCVPLPNIPGSFLLVPNEFSEKDRLRFSRMLKLDVSRVNPALIYNVFSNKTDIEFSGFPYQRKANPILACVKNKVYVLSCMTPYQDCIVEPSFEGFDPKTNVWDILTTPPFNTEPDTQRWCPVGYAVYKDYIILGVHRSGGRGLIVNWSYHTPTDKWNEVKRNPITRPLPRSGSFWLGEAYVIDGVIYGYVIARKLVAFNFSEIEPGILLLEGQTDVSGWVPFYWGEDRMIDHPCDGIGKIGEALLCNISIQPPRFKGDNVQHIGISFHYIDGFTCRSVGSSRYVLPPGDDFPFAMSCRVLVPGGDDGDRNELGSEKRAEQYKDYYDVEMKESTNMA